MQGVGTESANWVLTNACKAPRRRCLPPMLCCSVTLMTRSAAGGSCAEFLVHGVDVEGKQLGVDEALVRLLGAASPRPVTYAGGVRTLVRACPACPRGTAGMPGSSVSLKTHASGLLLQ